jgi:hypothetical protein
MTAFKLLRHYVPCLALCLVLLASMGAGCDATSCEDSSGNTYHEGAQWTCADGCNQCGCHDGEITRTLADCSSAPGGSGGANEDGNGGAGESGGSGGQ